MESEGFFPNDIFVPFGKDDFVPGHPNTSAQQNEEGAGETTDTLLIRAVRRGRLDLVQILIDQLQINLNQVRTGDGVTPLLMALQSGHRKILELLLDSGANASQARTSDEVTPLLVASAECKTDVVALLLANGAAVNQARTSDGMTPLMIASHSGHVAVVELLLKGEANVNQANGTGITPLWMASHRGYREIVELLLYRGADVNHPRTSDGSNTSLGSSKNRPHSSRSIVNVKRWKFRRRKHAS
jgi:uncharacterized protein